MSVLELLEQRIEEGTFCLLTLSRMREVVHENERLRAQIHDLFDQLAKKDEVLAVLLGGAQDLRIEGEDDEHER